MSTPMSDAREAAAMADRVFAGCLHGDPYGNPCKRCVTEALASAIAPPPGGDDSLILRLAAVAEAAKPFGEWERMFEEYDDADRVATSTDADGGPIWDAESPTVGEVRALARALSRIATARPAPEEAKP